MFESKSSVDEIRRRFDADVERFSDLETGQSATIDAPLAMELITRAAIATTCPIRNVLDLGCGAGNNTLKLCEFTGPSFSVDLLDLSQPMLERAGERAAAAGIKSFRTIAADFREADLEDSKYDVVLAAAVLHHLRDDADWYAAFEKLYRIIAPGGSVWITDLVSHEINAVQRLMWSRYGEYLTALNGDEYRDRVFEYVAKEDTPRPVSWQLDLLREAGFAKVELLHKNSCFAAFGAVKTA